MQIDNIRMTPWIPTVRRTTLMLMLACFGVVPTGVADLQRDETLGYTPNASSAPRSVFPWCSQARWIVGPGVLEHLSLSPRAIIGPGARFVEFLLLGPHAGDMRGRN